MNLKLEKVIKFSGWTPSPNTVTIGMERDNKVFSLKFEGMPEYPNGTAYLHIDCGENGADSIEVVDGAAEIKRNVTQYEGEKEAYVEILADGDVVWHSDVIMVTVKRLPILGGKIEQAYPTALEQALAQTAADKAAAAKSAADAAATAAGIVTEEAARQDAESKRVAAETARKQAEETRAEHERLRENAESERVKAETARETAEANREQAEAAREQEMADALASVTGAENTVLANEQQRVLAERTRAAQEQARQSAEQSRVEAEQAREQAEQLRKTAETSRAEAERQRESMETSRQTAETARNAAENGRAKAEKARVSAESQRQQAETARADAEGKRVQAEQGRVTAEQGRVEAEKKREEAMAQHAEKIAELETEVSKKAQIDDTTVSETAPWSSQHIVDMLCPPLEESGNPVVCYPVAGSKLGVTVSWSPTQDGTGTPSPDNIRPIHGRNNVQAERCGENLLNISQLKPEGYNLAGSNTLKPNTTYTFKPVSCGGINFALFLTDNIVPSQTTKQLNLTKQYIDEGKSATFTTPSNADSYSAMWLAGSKRGIDQVYPNVQFLLVAGTTAPSTYTPYTGSATTLTLPSTIYGGEVGADGEGQETWKLITLDGTENWIIPTTNDYFVWWAREALPTSADNRTGVCSHYKYQPNTNHELSLNVQPNGAVVAWHINDTYTTIADWKAYLATQYAAGTPVQIAYKLATPVPFQATGGGTIKALSDTNTILTNADTLTVTGRADLIHIIQQLQAASAASTQALADVERAVTDI